MVGDGLSVMFDDRRPSVVAALLYEAPENGYTNVLYNYCVKATAMQVHCCELGAACELMRHLFPERTRRLKLF